MGVLRFVWRATLMAACLSGGAAAGADDAAKTGDQASWRLPEVRLSRPVAHPVIACTADELARLKAAWAAEGPAHDVLAARFARADQAIAAGLTFPPEGGQHNQWYQCDACQMALQTVDAHHHKCPKCGKVYSGFPYDNVLYGRTHSRNIHRMETAAWAWAVTGERRYAEFAAKVMLGYADRYLEYPMLHASVSDKSIDVAAQKHGRYKSAGHLWEQTLNEAMGMIPLATAYDLVYDSGALTDDEKRRVETRFIRAMAECIDVHKAGKSNWQTWHNAALLWAGAVLGDEAMTRAALARPKNGFAFQMNACVSPEGMWYENSWGYHYYTLSAMTHIAEGARRLGIDLYSHPLLRRMYTLAFDYLMSDGSLPRFGDAVQDSPNRPSVNEKAYAVYGDERILSTLPAEPTWDSILLGRDVSKTATLEPQPSKVIPGAGHAILRTNGPGKLTAAMTFGPYGGFHGHFDKLSFVLFGYGEELGVDPGRAKSQAYRLPIHRQWYKAGVGHNVVLVDGKGQKKADGRLLAFAANDSYAAVAAEAGPAFENVTHRRFLLLTPTYLLVVDRLNSKDDKEHTFDWVYHNRGGKATCDLPMADATLGDHPGYRYLKDVSGHSLGKAGNVAVTFPAEKVTTHLRAASLPYDQAFTVFTATGPFRSVEDRVPMTVVRCTGSDVWFAAVLEPCQAGQKPRVKNIEIDLGGRGIPVRVHRSDGGESVMFLGGDVSKFEVHSAGAGERWQLVLEAQNAAP